MSEKTEIRHSFVVYKRLKIEHLELFQNFLHDLLKQSHRETEVTEEQMIVYADTMVSLYFNLTSHEKISAYVDPICACAFESDSMRTKAVW